MWRCGSSPWILKFQTEEARTPQETRRSFGIRPSLRATRFTRSSIPLTRKDNSSRPFGRILQVGFCLTTRWHRECHNNPHKLGFGISTEFPFAWPRRAPTNNMMADVSRGGFRLWLRIDSPMYKCCSHGTLLHVSPWGSHSSICYYHQDLCQGRLQVDSHRNPSTHTPAPPYSLRAYGHLHKACSASTVEYRPDARAPSIFRAAFFDRWVVTHSLADSDFHGHRPAVWRKRHPSWDQICVLSGALTRRLVHPTAPVLLTKNGPLGTSPIRMPALQSSKPGFSPNLKFENRLRSFRPQGL